MRRKSQTGTSANQTALPLQKSSAPSMIDPNAAPIVT
jgi:hypothetical protein